MNFDPIPALRRYLLDFQDNVCQTLAKEDAQGSFQIDAWQRNEGGGGETRILRQGTFIEQAGVNFSHIFGKTLPPAATQQRPELIGCSFQALGTSVVIHPLNPYVPTTHANVRFFMATKPNENPIWWFGGGFDLTPYYPFEEDCYHWHSTAAKACAPFGQEVYPDFKRWCDEYFFLKHRHETRGIGGLFFDDLNHWPFEVCFEFIQSIGEHFIKAYFPIFKKRKDMSYGERERNFQCYRRGRYVEFNLLYDRGTLFGLQSGGRTESILMSLPPMVHWRYHWQAEPGSREAELLHYLKPREWLNTTTA